MDDTARPAASSDSAVAAANVVFFTRPRDLAFHRLAADQNRSQCHLAVMLPWGTS